MGEKREFCHYRDPNNHRCSNLAEGSGYCYWHDTMIDKSGDDVKEKLEAYVRKGGYTQGISLKRANLEGIDLVNHNKKEGFDFSYADFYRANLHDAHLFNINLKHASLMKADLRDAKLNRANLRHANLLGVRWTGCKIEGIELGKRIQQEVKARKASQLKQAKAAKDFFEQAEEIYRDIRKHAEQEGIFTLSGHLIQKELTMRRFQMPRFSARRLASKVVDIFCGYGEAPMRIVGISCAIITLCALIYSITGLNYRGEVVTLSASKSLTENIMLLLSCLYYSVVTFTTLGYGDFTPVGLSRMIAAIQAFTGSFTLALFVVVFVKKMTR